MSRARAARTASTSPDADRRPRAVPGQLAVRVAPKAARRVQAALEPLGTVEAHAPGHVLILHKRARVTDAAVQEVVQALLREGLAQDATPVLRDPATGRRLIPTDEITVRFRPEASLAGTLREVRRTEGVSVARRNAFVPSQYVLRVPPPCGKRTLDIARRLQARADVEFAAPNYLTEVGR